MKYAVISSDATPYNVLFYISQNLETYVVRKAKLENQLETETNPSKKRKISKEIDDLDTVIDFIYTSVAKCSIGIKQIIHQRFLMRKPYNEICKGINLTHQYLYKLINEELEKKVDFVEMEKVKKILIQWQARGQNK